MCGRLPLAVRVAGMRLRDRCGASPARLAERLRPEHRRMDELAVRGIAVRPRLHEGYRDLGAADRRAFRLLGLLRGDRFPERAAAAVLGTGLHAARTRLEALVDAALLDPMGEDPAGDALYGMHELLEASTRASWR